MTSKKETSNMSLSEKLKQERMSTADSVMNFDFKKKRVKILSAVKEVKPSSSGVLYWMSREFRVQDNWSMLFAQKLALKNKIPLHIVFFLLPKFLDASMRQYKFLIKGIKEVKKECDELNISFNLYPGWPFDHLTKIVKDNNIGAVICDFFPLHLPIEWQNKVKEDLPLDVPLIMVDGHNIVPCWEVTDKQEYAARTIRNKINSQLDKYLTSYPPVIKHPYSGKIIILECDWDEAIEKCDIDHSVLEVDWAVPGYESGINMLESFCLQRLKNFSTKRNDPSANAISHLSPWLHFGQISPQRCILEVKKYNKNYPDSVKMFCEEAIVRRELSDNFCYFNPNYDNILGAANWAQTTLDSHRKDKRQYIYTQEELEKSETHDSLWNSAQTELVKHGKIHGYMRMYWAKKILEWTVSPEQALKIAIYFNDHYSMDGRDPNGYVGIMWSICGIHDQGWSERAIFGKIRYMNFEGCKRKFKVDEYILRWGGEKNINKRKDDQDDQHPKRKLKTK